jgi:formylglycine-generating enzyme required for sulfatase activity
MAGQRTSPCELTVGEERRGGGREGLIGEAQDRSLSGRVPGWNPSAMPLRYVPRLQSHSAMAGVGFYLIAVACGRVGYDPAGLGSTDLSPSGSVTGATGSGTGITEGAAGLPVHPPTGGPAGASGLAGVGGLGDTGSAGAGSGGDFGGGGAGAGGTGGSGVGGAGSSCGATSWPIAWACIDPGTFAMGSAPGEAGRSNDESLHQVTISRAFLMKSTEVTQSEWRSVMGNNPSGHDRCGTSCPVERVSWYQTIAYANALSAQDGYPPCYDKAAGGAYDPAAAAANQTPVWTQGLACLGYRLPTEAEWEYAARAGTTTAFWSGSLSASNGRCTLDSGLERGGWYCANATTPHAVATKSANPWGLYDMNGNVWEWVWDWNAPYATGLAIDPMGPATGTWRGERGGSYFSESVLCRSAWRYSDSPRSSFDDTGVRLSRSLP